MCGSLMCQRGSKGSEGVNCEKGGRGLAWPIVDARGDALVPPIGALSLDSLGERSERRTEEDRLADGLTD